MSEETGQRPIRNMELLAIINFIDVLFYHDAHPASVVEEFVDTLEKRGFEIVKKVLDK